MTGEIDIENSHTKKVITLEVPITEYIVDDKCIFDISNLDNKELNLLKDAINDNLSYTDIEIFYVSTMGNLPHFGPDFEYTIKNNKLECLYKKRR